MQVNPSPPQLSTQVGPEAGVPAADGVQEVSGLTRDSAGSTLLHGRPPLLGGRWRRREGAALQVRLLHERQQPEDPESRGKPVVSLVEQNAA